MHANHAKLYTDLAIASRAKLIEEIRQSPVFLTILDAVQKAASRGYFELTWDVEMTLTSDSHELYITAFKECGFKANAYNFSTTRFFLQLTWKPEEII